MLAVCSFVDIIIKREALDRQKPNFSCEFIEKFKVEPEHYDENLICIRAGMNPIDVEDIISELINTYNLKYNNNNKNMDTDFVVVNGPHGPTYSTWLKRCQGDKQILLNNKKFPSIMIYYTDETNQN